MTFVPPFQGSHYRKVQYIPDKNTYLSLRNFIEVVLSILRTFLSFVFPPKTRLESHSVLQGTEHESLDRVPLEISRHHT